MIDQVALRSFVIAAETLNFSEAAERRNTVQSAISAHISKLEKSLDRKLFDRGRGRAMILTAEGQAFLVYARRILSLSQEAVEAIQTAGSRRILRLGTTVTIALSVLPQALSAFASRYPDTQIHVYCDRSDALLARLDTGELDLAVMMDQGKRAGRGFVHSQPLVWVASEQFDLARESYVPLAFLSDGRDLRRYAFEALDAAGLHGKIAHLSPHPIGVRAFVQAGLAVTVMPKSTVAAPLSILEPSAGLPSIAPIAFAAYTPPNLSDEEISYLSRLLEAGLAT
ncbi:MAG: LysR family transcriptional regulator [Pseudomonadota bacterium]